MAQQNETKAYVSPMKRARELCSGAADPSAKKASGKIVLAAQHIVQLSPVVVLALEVGEPPQSALSATQRLPAWEPVDANFSGCARSCGAGQGVSRADARVQPGAAVAPQSGISPTAP